jgi:2-methylcitrate dehydratase PrpD
MRTIATVLGRAERFDFLHAALLNGISSHIFDFDDTHLKTVIHPAGPVASAILALAEHRKISRSGFPQRARARSRN